LRRGGRKGAGLLLLLLLRLRLLEAGLELARDRRNRGGDGLLAKALTRRLEARILGLETRLLLLLGHARHLRCHLLLRHPGHLGLHTREASVLLLLRGLSEASRLRGKGTGLLLLPGLAGALVEAAILLLARP